MMSGYFSTYISSHASCTECHADGHSYTADGGGSAGYFKTTGRRTHHGFVSLYFVMLLGLLCDVVK